MTLAVHKELPRLPLDGKLDLTYRCNNVCRHCWLWLPPDAQQSQEELTLEEIRRIVDEARAMGCQAWSISGGEPMLRLDFLEIFDYLTRKSVTYSLNTNGTLITPEIAHLMRRKGRKMVALYGATADIHDQVTRTPGSFEAMMRGIAYLKEAGAGFVVQIVPMRHNYHQYSQMLELAQSLSPQYRVGSAWLFYSACRSDARNREIACQRLDPADVIALDIPYPALEGGSTASSFETMADVQPCSMLQTDDRLFAACIAGRRDFHIDPYGRMTFCCFIKDPALRFDLRQGTFRQAWDEFIPSLADAVRGGDEYRDNCGACELRQDCRWCGVYGYLEHGRFSAKVEYLCQVAAETHHFREDWRQSHIRYFQIGGITIQVLMEPRIDEHTFDQKFQKFQVDGPGADTVTLRVAASMPALSDLRLGPEVYRQPPLVIYRQARSWTYIGGAGDDQPPRLLAIFDEGHNHGTIYRDGQRDRLENLQSLTTFPSDQFLLARLLADRQGCLLHAAGFVLNGQGLLFVGHSEAGKSTMMKMLRGYGEILCDDRIILRRWPEGFRIHGTWSHGELPDVSPDSAPLRAIFYLQKATTNQLIPLTEKRERLSQLLSYLIKPLITADWWDKILSLAGSIAAEVPAYYLQFDKSGQVVDLLQEL